MTVPITFRAVVQPGGPSFMPMQVLVVPVEVVEALGGKAVKRVVVALRDHTMRLGLHPLKSGERYLMLNQALLTELSLRSGDKVTVSISPDPTPNQVDLPEELAEGLSSWPEAEAAFERLTPGTKRALAYHIESAKRPETRSKRVVSVLHQLATGGHPFKPWTGG
ncbi:YdeI/OmpD-associated family protein [Hymenobacter profundi]|uniref:YdeI/OmpD-associated family protein n=1 Tax=Hymenobacter profundi TaxID=1982110 RepID=A0ABS6X4L3_9BACT|nr:YdeI/OmpD-associated family protein [Hymenobacter profundi]MBW3130775.1 YdeI/OmpD-associated family protein [Hymenobacter profundi]